jgi:hypothetical protein
VTPKWCKSGYGYTKLVLDIGVSRDTIKKKRFVARWVFAFIVINWLIALIGPHVGFTLFFNV